MKNFKKIITMALAAVMAVSAMSVSAMAEGNDERLVGEPGVPIVLYDSEWYESEGIMPFIDEPFWGDIPHSNQAGTNGVKVGSAFFLPQNHTKITVTITGLSKGIKTANLSLWDGDNPNTSIRTYDYYGESFLIDGEKGDYFTYVPTEHTKDMRFIVKGSTMDYGDGPDNGGHVTIRVVSQ